MENNMIVSMPSLKMKKNKSHGFEYERNSTLHVATHNGIKIIDFFLIEAIESIEDYLDFLVELSDAKPEDIVRVHINCYGGDVNVALNIYDALKLTQAQTEAWVEGLCASAASMIMLATDRWKVYPHSCVMVHAWSSVEYGKWHELKDKFIYECEFEEQFKDIYKNFMSDDEIVKCLNGKDFWFKAEETTKRLNNFQAETLSKQLEVEKIVEKYEKQMEFEIQKLKENKKPAAPKKVKKTKTEN